MLMYIYIVEKPQINSLYWTQNICEPGLRHSNREREDGKGRGGGDKTPYALSLPLPPCTLAGCPPTHIFVMANEARRYYATSLTVERQCETSFTDLKCQIN
jgi:hypothetical protein